MRKDFVWLVVSVCAWVYPFLSELVVRCGTEAERHGRAELFMITMKQKSRGRKEAKEASSRVYLSRMYILRDHFF